MFGVFAMKACENACISFAVFVCPSICVHVTNSELLNRFHEIEYWGVVINVPTYFSCLRFDRMCFCMHFIKNSCELAKYLSEQIVF
jgi:hypothetical protein